MDIVYDEFSGFCQYPSVLACQEYTQQYQSPVSLNRAFFQDAASYVCSVAEAQVGGIENLEQFFSSSTKCGCEILEA